MEEVEENLKETVIWSVSMDIIGYHSFSHRNNGNIFSHSPGGWESKVKSTALWLVSIETFLSRFHVSSWSLHVCLLEMWSGRDRQEGS